MNRYIINKFYPWWILRRFRRSLQIVMQNLTLCS